MKSRLSRQGNQGRVSLKKVTEKPLFGLTIAGTDPCGGAGINVDLQVFRDLGFHGMAAITAVVSQNTREVDGYHEVPPEILRGQLLGLLDDIPIHAVKIGMIPTGDLVSEVRRFLQILPDDVPVVLDPVMASGSGRRSLMAPTAHERLETLRPYVDLLTPNAREGAELLGRKQGELSPEETIAALLERRWKRVLLKGGHLNEDSSPADQVCDYLGTEVGVERLSAVRRLNREVRGTGCQLSTAIVSYRAKGHSWGESIRAGRSYLQTLIHKYAQPVGKGSEVVIRVEEEKNG